MNPLRKLLIGGTLAATTLAGGALGATLVNGTAGAETTASSPSSSTAPTTQQAPPQGQPSGPQGRPDPSKGGHQANGVTEALLTGTTKTKAEAAATAKVSGATVDRSETDAEGAAYEVHLTKSDGSKVTVKLDSSYAVTDVIDGMG